MKVLLPSLRRRLAGEVERAFAPAAAAPTRLNLPAGSLHPAEISTHGVGAPVALYRRARPRLRLSSRFGLPESEK